MLSISAIAADLADGVDGSRRSVALALSRMADGVHLLVERALDHLDDPEMAAIFAKQQSQTSGRVTPKNPMGVIPQRVFLPDNGENLAVVSKSPKNFRLDPRFADNHPQRLQAIQARHSRRFPSIWSGCN